MIIGKFIKEIELKHSNHYFSGLCFDSSKCKKDDIFLQLKEQKKMVINLLITLLKRVQKLLFQIKNLKA